MIRLAFAVAAFGLVFAPAAADEPKPRVELSGSIDDVALKDEIPSTGVIATQKTWEKLAKAWGIKDAPRVDFTKELLIVGTWRGSSFTITPVVKNGDLTVRAGGTKDLRPGFRWRVTSVVREGIKTAGGKELPKE